MSDYEWDDAKAAANLAKHGVSFEAVRRFDWESALQRVDDREDYGELRMVAIGFIGIRLHVLIYTLRGQRIRVLSLRKADRREVRDYGKSKA